MRSIAFNRQSVHAGLKYLRSAEVYWRYGSNLGPTMDHFFSKQTELSDAARRIVNDLRSDGIAVARVEDILSAELIAELESGARDLIAKRHEDIGDLKSNVDADASVGKKTFNLELLGSEPEFDPASPFAKIALSQSLLDIANSYLRMTVQMRYYNVWYTAASTGASRESQLWHYDREDNYILKAFLYLDDVDEGAGPFTYAPGTHRGGKYRKLNPEFIMEENVRRTTDDQMARVFPREKWRIGTGRKGTIIFADTRGYHKGGEARTRDRMMFTCMYTSPASQSKNLLRFAKDFDPASLPAVQTRALRIPQK